MEPETKNSHRSATTEGPVRLHKEDFPQRGQTETRTSCLRPVPGFLAAVFLC